ncbi:hypothetical protein AK812_SmicGene29552 [Symbiodinium microadriaticum]|uniref:Uncharacterized protein n=1 Tax=Symbiodinium microadriaticum TaxID=2951 RepID=A0A1Q9D1H9_SYMMI|nr:hypothetical protein AK812_SmicGene29552 [Symbiodinium microadriaticum]
MAPGIFAAVIAACCLQQAVSHESCCAKAAAAMGGEVELMPDPWASKPDSWDEAEESSLLDACPWLLLGLLITGALSAAAPPEGAAMGYLGGSGFSAIVKGSAFGLLSPLCSCGALPIALGLVNAGAGTATAVAFMVAAQAAGIDSLMFTIGVLGFRCALARLFAAGLVATAAGFAVPGAFTASHDNHIHGKQEHLQTLAAAVAPEGPGFFYLKIPSQELVQLAEDVLQRSREFFALPPAEKQMLDNSEELWYWVKAGWARYR